MMWGQESMITIGFYGDAEEAVMWQQSLAKLVPDCEVVDLLSDSGRMCDFALVWAPPPNAFTNLPNLKGIILQGQGVDHMMADETAPRDIPLVRLVDPDMSDALSHWAILNALDFWRNGPHYRNQQQQRKWTPLTQRRSSGGIVGVMGVGAIGSVIASRFAALGFQVRGWARTPRALEGVEIFAGMEGLGAFADGAEIIVSVLPLTPQTTAIMNEDFFGRLAKGAFIINGGRGPQIDDDDLLAALDSGQLGGAALDVFRTEPLPADHVFWSHPKISVWPHVAAQTNPATAARQVAGAITALMAGEEPANRVDWGRGY
jgi:glyoxylate/hydroxypyruvate reductase A